MPAIPSITAAFAVLRCLARAPTPAQGACASLGWLVGIALFRLRPAGAGCCATPSCRRSRTTAATSSARFARALRLPVAIRQIEAGWQGLRPQSEPARLRMRDTASRPVLVFDQVEAELAWASLLALRSCACTGWKSTRPTLPSAATPTGKIFVAGLEINTESRRADFADWLLAQERIVVRDATITWHDELRGAPPLALKRLNFDLRNSGNRHRFGLTAEPPRQLAARLDMRGDFKGAGPRPARVMEGRGLCRTRLRRPRRSGAPGSTIRSTCRRAAAACACGWASPPSSLNTLTADMRLADVQLRLGRDLPMLDLAAARRPPRRQAPRRRLRGRSEAADPADARRHRASNRPTSACAGRPRRANSPARGEFSANGLDLAALSDLAAHLPLDPKVRQKLATWAPRGRLHDLQPAGAGRPAPCKHGRSRGVSRTWGSRRWPSSPGFPASVVR